MTDVNKVVEDTLSEIKSLGGNVSAISAKVEKDLANIRSEVEGLSKSALTDPMVQAKIEAYGAAIGTRLEAIQKAAAAEALAVKTTLDARVDAVETAMRRSSMLGHNGGPAMEDQKEFRENAIFFTKAASALRNQPVPDVLDDEAIRFDEFRAYRKAFAGYLRRDERTLSPDQMKTLQSASDPDGGYLVEPTISARILAKVYESSPIRQLAMIESIGGTEFHVRIDHDETDFEWVGEPDLPASNRTPQLGMKRIVAHTMAARPKASQQQLEDASTDIAAWLDRKVADKFARGENAAFLLGNGRGRPRGLLTYNDGVSGETIEQRPTGAVDGFTFDAIMGLIYSLKEPYHANASWLMQRATVGKAMLTKDGDGTYLFRNVVEPGQRGFASSFAGYPLRMAADLPALATNALAAVFGDIRAAYTIVDRLGLTTQRDPYTQKPFVEFYTRRRVGGDVVNFEAVKLGKGATL